MDAVRTAWGQRWTAATVRRGLWTEQPVDPRVVHTAELGWIGL
ncbi:hypothetical protein CLV37_11356 [Kineococcus rhizosphaerae]|uniref:Uncharacterized protein n=1 Tax=Kineococcus rhizosphaerae TaxID=559628 RepID=A0A2T0QYI4_9ACTN|nr:hypothetical protein CLV37_11356 [Kineococcus rhizosphaerae]